MAYFIDNLPEDLVYFMVLPYLDQSFTDLSFLNFSEQEDGPIYPYVGNNYGLKYQCATSDTDYVLRKQVISKYDIEINFMISRIAKKNKKFRYYLTIEKNFLDNFCCCDSSFCMKCMGVSSKVDYTNYSSVYVKNRLYLFIWWSTISRWQNIDFPLFLKNKLD